MGAVAARFLSADEIGCLLSLFLNPAWFFKISIQDLDQKDWITICYNLNSFLNNGNFNSIKNSSTGSISICFRVIVTIWWMRGDAGRFFLGDDNCGPLLGLEADSSKHDPSSEILFWERECQRRNFICLLVVPFFDQSFDGSFLGHGFISEILFYFLRIS